jgi:hypothetical protein
MTASKVHQQMLDHIGLALAQGVVGDRVMKAAGQPQIHCNAYVNEARAHCGGSVIVVTPERKTYILGDGYANWSREATPDEIAGLPDTRGDNRGPSIPYAWFGEV